jgi:hypothetical protein
VLPRLVLPALLLLLLLARGSWGSPEESLRGYRRAGGPWGTVRFPSFLEGAEERLPAEIGAALARVEERLGRRRGAPFTAVLTPNQAEFDRLFLEVASRRPESWIAGVAFPTRHLLLVRGEAFPVLRPPAGRPGAVLEHELAHLVIHRRPGTPVPRWLDEGLAMWASGQAPDARDEAFLSGLARMRALYSLEALERELPSAHNLAAVAYQQSLLLVEWLVGRFGPSLPGELLDALEAGLGWREALEDRTALAVPELEEHFRAWLAGKRSVLEVLFRTVSLWTVASLLALLAILRGIVRRRRKLREMEAAESSEGGG